MKRLQILMLALIIVIAGAGFLLCSGTQTLTKVSGDNREKEIFNFFGQKPGPDQEGVVSRHLWLATHQPTSLIYPEYTAVHVVCREKENLPWQFVGTGTLLNKVPGVLITARHNLERKNPMQFGYRKIGKEELEGNSPVKPILGIINTMKLDDAISCMVGNTEKPAFISLPIEVANRPYLFEPDKLYQPKYPNSKSWVRLFTEPDKPYQALFCVEMRANLIYIVFDLEVQPGESGTGALVDGFGEPHTFCVITNRQQLAGDILKQLGLPPDKPKTFAVGQVVSYTY